jgi:hypothetical protein
VFSGSTSSRSGEIVGPTPGAESNIFNKLTLNIRWALNQIFLTN